MEILNYLKLPWTCLKYNFKFGFRWRSFQQLRGFQHHEDIGKLINQIIAQAEKHPPVLPPLTE